jgi:hypothetical protein
LIGRLRAIQITAAPRRTGEQDANRESSRTANVQMGERESEGMRLYTLLFE